MLVRLLLALLIALLPLPAAAAPACHAETPASTATAHHGHAGKQEDAPARQAPAEHLCVGCVAPATARAPWIAPPLAFAPALVGRGQLMGVPRAAGPPLTPPPRSAA
ncbi:hypothetical protein ACG3SL_02625 [Sphingomonas sp. CJ20]